MSLFAALKNVLPGVIDLDALMRRYDRLDWGGVPEQACIAGLAAADNLDFADYLARYPDVASAGMDPIMHYIRYGVRENRCLRLLAADAGGQSREQTATVKTAPPPAPVGTYSIIVTLWKRKNYLAEQYLAFMRQSLKPLEIIYLINGHFITPDFVRNTTGANVKIIQSDINSLYTRFAICYIAQGEYVSIVDDDIIPGELWFANAMRASIQYNAYVAGSGRLYNQAGKEGFYTYVYPCEKPNPPQTLSCSDSDIFCDWGCNSYFFKREWVPHIISHKRHKDSLRTFDDIQSAASLFMEGNIKCVTPMQPLWDRRLHASLKDEYGQDKNAVWLSSSRHFSDRQEYLETVIKGGYVPVHSRDNLYRFHIITPFGDRARLARCLLSIKAQIYKNYTCTLIDDCCDGSDASHLIGDLGLEQGQFRYIRNREKLYALRGHEIAMDLLAAAPADIIVHLDGDDWFAHPHVLWALNRIYRKGGVLATYGNMVALENWHKHDFSEFSIVEMSKRWNMRQDEPQAPAYPAARLSREDVCGGWEASRWFALHTRSFQFGRWNLCNRATLTFPDGRRVKYAADAAIMIPILNNCRYEQCLFTPEVSYVYQKSSNTTAAKRLADWQEAAETREHIHAADKQPLNHLRLEPFGCTDPAELADEIEVVCDHITAGPENSGCAVPARQVPVATTLLTVASPASLPDAMLAQAAYIRNTRKHCARAVFFPSRDQELVTALKGQLGSTPWQPRFPADLRGGVSVELEKEYDLASGEYRHAARFAIAAQLLRSCPGLVVVLDPEVYAVADIADIQSQMERHSLSLFPLFFNPEDEESRTQASSGLLSPAMLGVRPAARPVLEKLCTSLLNAGKKKCLDGKILDSLIEQAADIWINQDRGINYRPSTAFKAEGLVSPGQRGFLLKTGNFARVWRIDGNFIKEATEAIYWTAKNARLVVAVHLFSKLLLALLLVIHALQTTGRAGVDLWTSAYENTEALLNTLSRRINVHGCRQLLVKASRAGKEQVGALLNEWVGLCLQSICFDNFEVFARLLEDLFGNGGMGAALAAKLRSFDLRYITEDVLADPQLSQGQMERKLEAEPAGAIIRARLDLLRACGLEYA